MKDPNPRFVTAGEIVAREIAILTPADRPESAQEGTVYSDKNDHYLYFFNGTNWIQLDKGGGPPA